MENQPATWKNTLGMEFVLIPAGEFLMGSARGESSELPVHKVTISQACYLGKYPVTQGQWQEVIGENPSHFKGDPTCPVENVSWDDVQKFIEWLHAREGDRGYRLPTEAEWEYACRAGTTTAYCFGNDPDQLHGYAWYGKSLNSGSTHPVGQLKPNDWGLYDMHGNVWEWVQDWYGKYAARIVSDPQGSAEGASRVVRGGGWYVVAQNCRAALRYGFAPDFRVYFLGFRLARSVALGP